MKRGRFLCAAAALILLFSAPLMARAQEGGSQGADKLYLKLNAGALSPRDVDVDDGLDELFGTTLNAELDTGFFVGASVGRSFGQLRGEIEIFYGQVDYTLNEEDRNGEVFPIDEDDAEIAGLMFNAWFDLGGRDWALNPYVGGGVGAMRLDVPGGSDTGFSWQLGAGAIFPIGNNLALDASYRFLNTAYEPEIDSIEYEKIQAHVFLLGITLTF